MKKAYHNLILFLEGLVLQIHLFKMRVTEYYSLYRKKELYGNIKWDNDKSMEFKRYWKHHYGKSIISNGHKLYESINGVYQVDYFPDFLFATKLEPLLNPYYYAKIYSDKSLTELLYADEKEVQLPRTHVLNSGGIFYNGNRLVIDAEEAENILSNIGEVVMKPTVGGSSGFGIKMCKFENGIDKNSSQTVKEIVRMWNRNFIAQERMFQHETFSRLYPTSINTIRCITYVLHGRVYTAKLSLRMGSDGRQVDNIHSGGIVIGVENNGCLKEYGYRLGYSDSKEKHAFHPDTNIVFKGYKIEGTERIIEVAKRLHGRTPHLGMISWDFMVTKNNMTALIEANYYGQSIWFPQIVHEEAIFGDNTKLMLDLIR